MLPAVMAGLLALAGCGPAKLDETKTLVIDPAESPARSVILSAQPKAQAVTVEFESTADEVNVGVFKDADAKDLNTVAWAKAIKAETGKKSGTFTADIPENTAAQVVVGESKKKTDVKVHVTNKKK
jgi:hypothetical protein